MYLKIKYFRDTLNRREDVFLVILIILVGLGSFALGRLSVTEKGVVHISEGASLGTGALSASVGGEEGMYVGSVNGSKYHAPWCSGAGRIKEENKVWFSSQEEAQRAGYEPAANCKGI